MEKFVIQGGAPLSGEIVAAGNKNAALPSIAACLLTDEEVVLSNVPRIRDTEAQIALLDRLGVKVEWSAENALMAAALTPGPTTIANAACEPHVQDLARLLVRMGAQIDGIGSNVITVHGRDKLGGAEHRLCADHIEVASFMALAAATKGELRIRDAEPDDLIAIRRQFRRLGLQSMVDGRDVLVPPEQALEVKTDLGDAIPKIEDGPWPAFPADLTSIALALATQAEGTVLIFEKMFENRLFFVDKLVAMGARIHLSDPHRAVVSGPSRLHGERVDSPDIRAGMAMLIAALCAEGTTEIGNVRQIDRGYERIDLRLRELGARIERVSVEPVPA